MSTNNDELLYDEDDSVKFIQNYLPQELKGKFSNDDINYIVIKNAQKDGVGKFEPEEITFIVQGELEYCDSINMFD